MNCIRKWETNTPNHSKLPRTEIKSLPERNGQCIDCNPNPNHMKPGQTEWTPEQIDEREKTKYFKRSEIEIKNELNELFWHRRKKVALSKAPSKNACKNVFRIYELIVSLFTIVRLDRRQCSKIT